MATGSSMTNWDNAMVLLIMNRKKLQGTKSTYFGKYLEIVTSCLNEYCKEIGEVVAFKDYLVPCVIDDWEVSVA